MELAIEGIKQWVEPAMCIGYIRHVDGRLASVFEGVARFIDSTTSKAWTIQEPAIWTEQGWQDMPASPEVYLDCPQIDIWNTLK